MPRKANDKLESAFNFTDADLESNHAGEMSDNQRAKLAEDIRFLGTTHKGCLITSFILMLFPIAGAIVALAYELRHFTTLSHLISGLSPVVSACFGTATLLAVLMAIIVVPINEIRKFKERELTRGTVAQLSGTIALQDVGRGAWQIRIDKHTFPIKSKQLLLLRNNADYTLYYLPRDHFWLRLYLVNNRILSLEPIEQTETTDVFGSGQVLLAKHKGALKLGDDGELTA